jgi:hypothetical protein
MTGHYGGITRWRVTGIPAYKILLKELFNAEKQEFSNIFASFFEIRFSDSIFILLLVSCVIVLVYSIHTHTLITVINRSNVEPKVFILTGLVYWASLVCFRFYQIFDPFGYRLLCPATILLTIGVIAYFAETKKGKHLLSFISGTKSLRYALLIVLAFGALNSNILPLRKIVAHIRTGQPVESYYEHFYGPQGLKQYVSVIKSHSVVICFINGDESNYIKFLRPDVMPVVLGAEVSPEGFAHIGDVVYYHKPMYIYTYNPANITKSEFLTNFSRMGIRINERIIQVR